MATNRPPCPPPPSGDVGLIEAINDRIETYVGAPATVYHQLVSEYVHVDIHMITLTDERPWHTLITSGMSELPMTTPPQFGAEYQYAEFVLSLPRSGRSTTSPSTTSPTTGPSGCRPSTRTKWTSSSSAAPRNSSSMERAEVSELLDPQRPGLAV